MLAQFEAGTPPSDKDVLGLLGEIGKEQRDIETRLRDRPPWGGVNDPGSAINLVSAQNSLQLAYFQIQGALVIAGNPLGTELAYSELRAMAAGTIAAGAVTIQFGRVANQISHTFRHTDALGLDRTVVKGAVEKHLQGVQSQIVAGKPFNQVIEVGGVRIQYTAFKLENGVINVGRIQPVP